MAQFEPTASAPGASGEIKERSPRKEVGNSDCWPNCPFFVCSADPISDTLSLAGFLIANREERSGFRHRRTAPYGRSNSTSNRSAPRRDEDGS